MKLATVTTIVLLVAVAIGHVARLAFGVPVTIADQVMPMWVSWIGVVVAGGLAVALWRADRSER